MTRMKMLLTLTATAAMTGSLLLVPPAGAVQPEREKFSFGDVFDFPAGTICDFAYHREFSITGTRFFFSSQDGNFARDMEISKATILHRNTDTGYTLSETLHSVSTFSEGSQTVRVVGLNWHLRDDQGRIVVVHAGQVVFDVEQGELVKATPNFAPEFPEVLCPALGGSPA